MVERANREIEKVPEELIIAYVDYVNVLDNNARDYVVNIPGHPMNRAQLAQHLLTKSEDDAISIEATKHLLNYTLSIRNQRGLTIELTMEELIAETVERFNQDKRDVEKERESRRTS